MKLENLANYCRSLPYIVEDIKWGTDMVFSIDGGTMFCVFSYENNEYIGMSFKVDDHRFLEMTDRPQFVPAPYMARARWVKLVDTSGIAEKEVKELVSRSHQMYFEKLSKKAQRALLES